MSEAVLAPDATELANRLRPVLLKLARALRQEVHSLGVTGGQVSLLVQVKYAPGIEIRELAATERISVPAVSKFVSRMEAAGLLQATTLTFVIVATQIGLATGKTTPTRAASLLAAGLLSAALFPAGAQRLLSAAPVRTGAASAGAAGAARKPGRRARPPRSAGTGSR